MAKTAKLMSKTAKLMSRDEPAAVPRGRRDTRTFVILSTPAWAWFSLFMLVPFVFMVYVSLRSWRRITEASTFTGLENYSRLLTSTEFWDALRRTLSIAVVALPIVGVLSFMLAFFLVHHPPGYRLLRVIFFAPVILSFPAQTLIFSGIYRPDGLLDSALSFVGLDSLSRVWLGNTTTALWALTGIYIWGAVGFNTILLYASLSLSSKEPFEMATVDGAGYWTRMWRIAFPLNLDFFGLVMMLEFLFVLLDFSQYVILLTGGGPGRHTVTLGYLLFEKAFVTQQIGFSQAIGVVILLLGMVIMLVIRLLTRRTYE